MTPCHAPPTSYINVTIRCSALLALPTKPERAQRQRHGAAEQQRKRDEHRATADELDRKIAMVGETIAGLSASMDRAQVLAESIDPHIDLREDGGTR